MSLMMLMKRDHKKWKKNKAKEQSVKKKLISIY